MKKIQIALFMILFGGTLLSAQQSASSDKKAVVYFVRHGSIGVCRVYDFYNNNQYVGGINGFGYLKLECNPGEQLFWCSADNRDFIKLNLVAGQSYIIEGIETLGWNKGSVYLNLIDKDQNGIRYKVVTDKISKRDPKLCSAEKLERKNRRQAHYISKKLDWYRNHNFKS